MSDEIDGTDSAAPIDSSEPMNKMRSLLWMCG